MAITSNKDTNLLVVGDWSYYVDDTFKNRWIAYGEHNSQYPDFSIPFIPNEIADLWSEQLTGRRLENKMYVIVHTDSKILALYRHDDLCGLIEILSAR